MSSPKPVVVVFTGNSNTGAATVRSLRLFYKGQITIRAVVRKEKNGKDLEGIEGVEVIVGNLNQPKMLAAVFKDDVNAAFLSTPAGKDRVRLAKTFVDACIDYGVDFPIIVSAVGAGDMPASQHTSKPMFEFAEIEEYCAEKAGTPVKRQMWDNGKQVLQPIILRCGLFYENMKMHLLSIQKGVLYLNAGEEGIIPHTSVEDVGKVAATLLVEPEQYGGKTFNVISENQSAGQMASSITVGLGNGCKYEMVDDAVSLMAYQASGQKDHAANQLVDMVQYYREGGGQGCNSDVKMISGKKVTKFSEFVKTTIKPLLNK